MSVLPAEITTHLYPETDSTNKRARNHLTHGALILAEQQTKGRGRYGNTWISPKGNLYMSLVWQVADLGIAGQYAFVCAVALAKSIQSVCGDVVLDLSLKWPNDILLKGKKLAGILLETEQRDNHTYLIIGIGVNLVSSPDYATDLTMLQRQIVKPQQMCDAFMESFSNTIKTFEKNGFSAIRGLWLDRAHGLGKEMTARLQNQNITGIFDGIDETGALLLQQQDGHVTRVTSGEVFFT